MKLIIKLLALTFVVASCQKESSTIKPTPSKQDAKQFRASGHGVEIWETNGFDVQDPEFDCWPMPCDCIGVIGSKVTVQGQEFIDVVATNDPQQIKDYFLTHGNEIVPITEQQLNDILSGEVTIKMHRGDYLFVYTNGNSLNDRPVYPKLYEN